MADLVVSDLSLRLDGNEVLKGVSLRAAPGKIVALLGPPGSGKTSLLRAIAGLETPHRGSIRMGDTVFFDAAQAIDMPAERRGVGLVFESHALWPHRTAFDNIAYALKLRGVDETDLRSRVGTALAELGLGPLATRLPDQLSGSEQQRVALARALVYEPALVLLDEPFANLDGKQRIDTRLWLRQVIAKHNLAAIVVTHDQTEALAIASRITLINGGLVEQDGTPLEVYSEPRSLAAAEFIGSNNRFDGMIASNNGQRATIEIAGVHIEGIARTSASAGEPATAIIRMERTLVGGGPGPNRVPMTLAAQHFLGERWELVFVKAALTVRAFASAPLKHEFYHVELPADSVWIF